jgi:hypothetical protein
MFKIYLLRRRTAANKRGFSGFLIKRHARTSGSAIITYLLLTGISMVRQ